MHLRETDVEAMALFERRKHEERSRSSESTRQQLTERRAIVEQVTVDARRLQRGRATTAVPAAAAQFTTKPATDERNAPGTSRTRVVRTVVT